MSIEVQFSLANTCLRHAILFDNFFMIKLTQTPFEYFKENLPNLYQAIHDL